jgi:hypothetical protein
LHTKKLILLALLGIVLVTGLELSLASAYGSCEAQATVICHRGAVSHRDESALQLSFEISGTPKCRGVAGIHQGQVYEAAVLLPMGIEATAINRGTRVRLQYNYNDSLTPEGITVHEEWTLLPDQPSVR